MLRFTIERTPTYALEGLEATLSEKDVSVAEEGVVWKTSVWTTRKLKVLGSLL